ncbi:carbohydrate-binding protein [Microbulbifer thermotolerans]|uniref:carbohydrate-binding protein n=1 Tax=Microbulbifer thermotolerans TaxID=252514 RepID=UPI0009EE22F6|nr:carbohydrate-binding protein [Microbulbifer thermotolerans]MCX2781599.1 carbohydrate-binding protein [Microbulbifer thermotolerans]MCX2794758.1 carbohydrate-binding protein [Microbulbifer thermotolerans]
MRKIIPTIGGKWSTSHKKISSRDRSPGIASTLLLALAFLWGDTAQAQYLHTEGTQIVDGNGNPVHLNGINLGNWLLWEGYLMMGDFNYRTHTQFLNSLADTFGSMAQAKEFEHQWRLNYVTEREIADLKSLGFNAVRVPFHYNLFWENGQLSDHGFQYLDRLIDYCRTHGLYVLLDMHAAPGYQNPGDHSDNIDSNASQPRDSVKFWDGDNVLIASQVWRHIADYYKNEPVIWGYDLINEPVPQAGREYELLPSLIAMRNAIREVDNNHAIIAEGSWWASDLQKIDWTDSTTQTNTGVNSRWDHNLVYQTHHYVFGNAGAVSDLYPRADRTNNMGVPLILGEYGEDNNDIIRQLTDWSANNIAGQFPWSFKKMSHDRTLWTIQPNSIYSQVVDYINHGGTPPANAYAGMIDFAQNHIGNGSANVSWHQDFYDAIKTNSSTPPPASCDSVTPHSTGRIEAESYCSMSGIQLEDTSDSGGGQNVGWIDSGDWLEYRVDVPQSGVYTLTYRIASTTSTGQLRLMSDGTQLADTSFPNTGGWQNWQSVSLNVNLSAGIQTLRLQVAGGGFNLNWIELGASSQDPGSIANGEYQIRNLASGLLLGVADSATTNGGNVIQGGNQSWQITALGDGSYRLENTYSGLALDVQDASTSNGANIQQWEYGGGDNQNWLIEPVDANRFRIISVHSGKSLDVQDGSTEPGGNIQQWTYHGGDNQLWLLEK